MKTALVTGISGQDGRYLATLLWKRGYRVVGTTREPERAGTLFDIAPLPLLLEWNMLDEQRFIDILRDVRPDEIYNLAAHSSGAGMWDSPVEIGDINGLTVLRILEAIRESDASIRFCQAGSSELFGEAVESPQDENTVFRPRSPYGIAKLYAHEAVRLYRSRFNLFASSAILFNHESPIRDERFVTRKITRAAARISRKLESRLQLGNLDAKRDWGFAGDSVEAMWLILQAPTPGDYVVATGKSHSVRDICRFAFGHVGLDYQDYVSENTESYRREEVVQLLGNSTKAASQLGWAPSVSLEQLIGMMVDNDIDLIDDSESQQG